MRERGEGEERERDEERGQVEKDSERKRHTRTHTHTHTHTHTQTFKRPADPTRIGKDILDRHARALSCAGLLIPQRHIEEAVHDAIFILVAIECVDHGLDSCRLARSRFLEKEDGVCFRQQCLQPRLIPLQFGNRPDILDPHDVGAVRAIMCFDDLRFTQDCSSVWHGGG